MDYLLVKRQGGSAGQTGSNQDSPQSSSISSLVSTLVPVLLLAVVYFFFFLILRTKYPRQYAPRTYLGSLRKQERTEPLPNSRFGWFGAFNKIPDTYVLQHNSLDAFFLLRYIKISIIIALVGLVLTWPVLFPVNATGGGGQAQLNILSFSNVQNGYRYFAHAILACVFISFVFYTVTREMIFYINLRQAYLLSPLYADRISSRTVLFQSTPTEYASEAKIRRMFGDKLKNVWIVSDTKELETLVDQRTKTAMKLEGAETKLIALANKNRLKAEKKSGPVEHAVQDVEMDAESGAAAARWVAPKKRPTHRLKPLIGKKVDTINWSREEIARLNPQVAALQDAYRAGQAKPLNAVFVEFFTQTEAQSAFQMVAHHQPLHMAPRVVGVRPEEVIWSNMGITWRTRTVRNIISLTLVSLTVVFWCIPVAVVGAISNINALEQQVHFLRFINHIPGVILGVVTGLLPTVMLAVLMALLPVYLRFMAKFAGMATLSLVELRCHESYFWFQVIQVFIVTTLTSAATAVVPTIIKNPGSAISLLANNLPKASNFYISYLILLGLSFSSGALLQIVGLLVFKILGKFLDSTPRKMYNRWSNLSALGWGTIFPAMELLTVITITYSCIAPLILGFAVIGLFLFYFAYRYNLLFVNTSNVDTKGLVYVKALKHTLVGCYLLAICLIGLFAIKAAQHAIGPLVIMVVFFVFMVLYHISLISAVDPLLYYIPRSLEAEEETLLHGGAYGVNGAHDAEKEAVRSNGSDATVTEKSASPVPTKAPNMLTKWLRPDIYASYHVMRKLVNRDFADITYADEVERDAFQHPAVLNVTPLLWVPRDPMGVSRQECAHTNKITPMTDQGAYLDDKGKVVWDQDETDGRPPIYQERIYY